MAHWNFPIANVMNTLLGNHAKFHLGTAIRMGKAWGSKWNRRLDAAFGELQNRLEFRLQAGRVKPPEGGTPNAGPRLRTRSARRTGPGTGFLRHPEPEGWPQFDYPGNRSPSGIGYLQPGHSPGNRLRS